MGERLLKTAVLSATLGIALIAFSGMSLASDDFAGGCKRKEQAIETANRITKETLCDCVKLEGGANMSPTIRAMVDAGINVMGHIGMTPQTATSFGGFKVQGGTPESARKLIEDAKALEAAGVFAMVVECVPSVVAKAMQEEVERVLQQQIS